MEAESFPSPHVNPLVPRRSGTRSKHDRGWYCWPCSIHSLPLPSLTEPSLRIARQDGEEKNPDLTHSRPKEQAGEFAGCVAIGGSSILGRDAARPRPNSLAEKSESRGQFGETETESMGSASGAQSSQKRIGPLGGVANTQRSFRGFRWKLKQRSQREARSAIS